MSAWTEAQEAAAALGVALARFQNALDAIKREPCHVYEFVHGRSICVKCGAERTAVIDF